MIIRLTEDEYALLRQLSSSCPDMQDAWSNATLRYDKYRVELPDEKADELRDMCGEELQRVGFDEDYALTEMGILLEGLVDKLYSG